MSLWGLAGPAAQALMSRRVAPSEQGRLQGANSSLMAVAGLLGPMLFTQCFALAVGPFRPWGLVGAPFLLASLLMVLALLLARTLD
jgi:DHA1 family tetracycline resistance protein-like MFS transporter